MKGLIREWILAIACTSLITALATALTPESRVKKVVRLVGGTAVLVSLLGPVINLDFSAYSMNLEGYRQELGLFEKSLDETNDRLSRTIIEEQSAAYILDKAQVLGVNAAPVRVAAKWGDEGCWYPYEVYLGTTEPVAELSRIIEAELGVPGQRQYWGEQNEG